MPKPFTVVVAWDAERHITKFLDFETRGEADAHVRAVADRYPGAFVTATPGAPLGDWKVNPSGNGLLLDPQVRPPRKAPEAEAVTSLLIEKGVFTQEELDQKRLDLG